METVTIEQCKAVIRERKMNSIGHHRCAGCGAMVGYEFSDHKEILPEWVSRLGLAGPEDVVAWFNSSCGCGPRSLPQPVSWMEFADTFNRQTPDVRAALWARFQAGQPLIED